MITSAEILKQTGVVILAAGASTRMGRPKMLLPWGNTSVVGQVTGTWRELGARQIAMVLRPDATDLERERVRLGFIDRIINRHAADGMFSSIQAAALWDGWEPELTHWVIALGDQPQLSGALLEKLMQFAATHPSDICQPSYGGRGRHPVVLTAGSFRDLRQATAVHLKEFLQQRDVLRCEINDPALDFDLDYPEDYEQALRLFAGLNGRASR